METTVEENLNEVLQMSPAEVEVSIVSGATSVCDTCVPFARERAHCLSGFAGIGRLSISKAVELLSAYNQAICTHIGAIAVTEILEPELVSV